MDFDVQLRSNDIEAPEVEAVDRISLSKFVKTKKPGYYGQAFLFQCFWM